MNPMLKQAIKILLEDKGMQKMYADFNKMAKELEVTLKESEALKKKWK